MSFKQELTAAYHEMLDIKVVVLLAVLRFGKLPCDKGTGGRFVKAQSEASAIVKGNGFQNLIALIAFYVFSSFLTSGQVGPR